MNQASQPGESGDEPPIWHTLCPLAEVPPLGGRFVDFAGKSLAVFRLEDGSVRVIDDTCPHAGGSLSAGALDSHLVPGAVCVICPRHAWPFNLDTGACPDSPDYQVATYPARVVSGQVQVRMSPGD